MTEGPLVGTADEVVVANGSGAKPVTLAKPPLDGLDGAGLATVVWDAS